MMKKSQSHYSKKPPAKKSEILKPDNFKVKDSQFRELKFHGSAACMMIWRKRADDIARIYVQESRLKEFRPLLKWAADHRKGYHIVEEEDLQRLTESSHHQGICIIAKEHSPGSIGEVKSWLKQQTKPQLLVYLDGVENPHNLGAILRTCAHFNIPFILRDEKDLSRISASACRVAEGGAEYVKLVPLKNSIQQLKDLQDMGCELLATSMSGVSVYQHSFHSHTILIMGAEITGVSKAIFEISNKMISVPGSGQVESLNVSVAFSVLAGEFYRQAISLNGR